MQDEEANKPCKNYFRDGRHEIPVKALEAQKVIGSSRFS